MPIPNVEGGAIETLVTEYLNYASKNNLDKLVVYTPFSEKLTNEILSKYENVEFRQVDTHTSKFRLGEAVCAVLRRLLKCPIISNYYARAIVKDIKLRHEENEYKSIIIENEVSSIMYVKKKLNGKVISHMHNDYFNKDTQSIKKIVKYCDEVWCVSKYIASRASEVIDSKEKVRLLYNGVNLDKFSIYNNAYSNNSAWLNKKKDDSLNFLFVGRIYEGKGLKELVCAFNELSKKHRDIKLNIVGSAIKDNPESKAYCDEVVKLAKHNSNISFKGFLKYDDLKQVYSQSDIQVIPSIVNEAFGLVAIEAMACGLPVIATNSGGLPELINERSGKIVETEDLEHNLIQAMEYFINNKDDIEQMRKYNLMKCKEYSIDNYCRNFYELLHTNKF